MSGSGSPAAMGVDPFKCPKCGSRMFNDLMNYGYRCFSCGNHEPFGHNVGSRRGAAAPARGEGAPAGTPGAGGRAAGPASAGPGMDDILFHPSTLGRLASILCVVYRNVEITDLLKRSGFPPKWNYSSDADWKFLYGCLESVQRDFGPYGVIRVLETACGPQDMGNVRKEVNECLAPYGLEVRKDGPVSRTDAAGPPAGGDAALFDQGKYHRLVVEHARAKFLKGEYLGAVSEACKAFEGMIRKKSGIDDYGVQLMKGAFGDGGALEVDAAGLSAATRKSWQRGLESLCVGMVSSVRNPVSHEPESSLGIGREGALDMLGIISHLCRQVDGTRRRRGRAPRKGGKGGTGEDAAGSRRAPRGGHGGEHHGTKGGEDGRLTARPDGSPGRAGDGGGPGAVDKNPEPKDDDSAFDQRGYHELVVEHARAKFLKGEYFSAVTECCKAFEELVQKKSRLAEDGADLMGKAFGPEGALAVNFPGLKGKTRENMRSGLMHLCMGMVANVRNPVSHELERKFCMGRKDALDILGTISYLCRQVEGTRRRRRSRRAPPKGGKSSPKADARKDAGERGQGANGGGGPGAATAEPHGHGRGSPKPYRIHVESSDLSEIEYDPDSETLRVWFHGGGSHLYTEVSESTYDELIAAPSIAKYFHRHIKGAYGYRQLD